MLAGFSGELKMYQQPIKQVTEFPEWIRLLLRSEKLVSSSDGFARVPLVYRAVNLRCNSLVQIPHKIINSQTGEEMDYTEDWPFSTPLDRLLWFTEASLLLKGFNVWVKLRSVKGITDVLWLNPLYTHVTEFQNIEMITEETEFPVTLDILQGIIPELQMRFNYADTLISGNWPRSDVVYYLDFNPFRHRLPGIGAAEVGLQDAQIKFYLNRFASHFFEGGAQPVTILGVQGAPDRKEIDRVQNFFKKAATGVRNAFNVIGIRGDIKPAVLTPPLKDLAMGELSRVTEQDIADAFQIPIAMLRDPNNRATADSHRYGFFNETVIPRAGIIATQFNEDLGKDLGIELVFNHQEMDLFQQDESHRSTAVVNLVNSGMDLDLALEVLGYDLTDEQWLRLGAGMEEQRQREQLEQERINERLQLIQQQQNGQQAPTIEQEVDEKFRFFMSQYMAQNLDRQIIVESREMELKKWQKKAIKALHNEDLSFAFRSNVLTEDETIGVLIALGLCKTEDQIKAVFDHFDEYSKRVIGDPGEDVPEDRKRLEKNFVPKMKAYLSNQVERISDAIRGAGNESPPGAFWSQEVSLMSAFLAPLTALWGESSVSSAAVALNSAGLGLELSANERAARFAAEQSLTLAKGLNRTTRDLTRIRLSQWIQSGEEFGSLITSLQQSIAPRWRAKLIGSTEITAAYGNTQQSIAENEMRNVVKGMTNLTANDERVCPICGPLHGETRKVKGVFPGGLKNPPYHPSCRCGIFFDV